MYYSKKVLSTMFVIFIFIINSSLIGAKCPPPAISIASKNTPKTVLAFASYYNQGDTSSYNSLVNNASKINQIATQTYTTDKMGKITGLVPLNQLNYANKNKITALAMVSNNFDGNIAKVLLETTSNRQALVDNILKALKANNYKGVNMDFEGVLYYDRSYYTLFIKELSETLHKEGYILSLSLPAKTNDNPKNPWNGAYDYVELGNYADEVLIRSYDEHYAGGASGPIASIDWVENVIKYAISTIPAKKILLGVATYGYDWSSSGTKAYGMQKINNIASAYKSSIMLDASSKTPFFKYTDINKTTHTIWFENTVSLGYKLNLVNKYNLGGIGIWRIGLETSDYWTTIKNKL